MWCGSDKRVLQDHAAISSGQRIISRAVCRDKILHRNS